jgi:hypothetical protein
MRKFRIITRKRRSRRSKVITTKAVGASDTSHGQGINGDNGVTRRMTSGGKRVSQSFWWSQIIGKGEKSEAGEFREGKERSARSSGMYRMGSERS